MRPPLLPVAAAFAAFSSLAPLTAQGDSFGFQPKRTPMVRLAVHDAPGLLAALPDLAIGRLFAEADVARAIGLGRDAYVAKVQRWSAALDRLAELDPARVTFEGLVQREVMALDWRDLHGAELLGTLAENASPFGIQTVLLVRPTAASEARLAPRFEGLLTRLRELETTQGDANQVTIAADQVDGHPGLVLAPGGEPQEFPGYGPPPGGWFVHAPGLFAGGDGALERAGTLAVQPVAAPGITLAVDFVGYLRMLSSFGMTPGGAQGDPFDATLRALGVDGCRRLLWQLRPDGERLLDELSLELPDRPGGLLGALLDGVAPPVAQPLPERALLQLRLAFDVGTALAAVDDLLTVAELPTLGELGLVDDLRLAWTGGVALALVRPAPGGLVPRLYASVGIVDHDALGRLLARLETAGEFQRKDVTYEGQPSVQLRIDGAPPALQPSYCVQRDAVHFAESGISLRALLKAQKNGAPPLLSVGDAPRPGGEGAIVPGVELRFDGAEIHAALHELWLPLAEATAAFGSDAAPLVARADLPEPEIVAPHLRKGRGVLRRGPDRVTLAMSGTAGGPELHALLFAYGSLLSGPMTGSWRWQTDELLRDVARLQLPRLHAAVEAFAQRTGKPPASFGELLAGGDLDDPRLLVLPGDTATQAVEHDGKEIARTSFVYHPDGKKTEVNGEEVVVRFAILSPLGWQSLVLDTSGTLHDVWGDFGFANLGMVQVLEEVEVVEEPPPPPEPVEEPK